MWIEECEWIVCPGGNRALTRSRLIALGGVAWAQVHAIRDAVWQGVPPEEGSAWIRDQPLGSTALLLLLVPTSGGLAVGILNSVRSGLTDPPSSSHLYEPSALSSLASQWRAVARPILKALAAVVTLGTGNSLGPEGPSVEIGSSVAKGASSILQSSRERTIALVAAGSAAGIASGEMLKHRL